MQRIDFEGRIAIVIEKQLFALPALLIVAVRAAFRLELAGMRVGVALRAAIGSFNPDETPLPGRA